MNLIPAETTDIYIQREWSGYNVRFLCTFIKNDELNGYRIISEESIQQLRYIVEGNPQTKFDNNRILITLH